MAGSGHRKAEFTITGKDQLSSKFKKASNNVNSDINKIKRNTISATNSMTTSWRSLLGVIGSFGAAYAGIKFFKDIVKEASSSQETLSRFKVIFGDIATEAQKQANILVKEFGRSRSTAQDFLAIIQDTLVPMGMARDKALELASAAAQLAVDMGSMYDTPAEKVLLDLQSALVGNGEVMKKYSTIINETTLKQEALNQGWIKSKKEITPVIKAQAALSLAMKGAAAAIGDYKRTSDGYANSLATLKEKIKDLKGSLGEALLPVLTDIIKRTTEWISKNEEFIAQKFKEYVDKVVESVKALVEHADLLKVILIAIIGLNVGATLLNIASGIKVITTSIIALQGAIAGSAIVKYLLGGQIPGGGKSALNFFRRSWILIKANIVAFGRYIAQFGTAIPIVAAAAGGIYILAKRYIYLKAKAKAAAETQRTMNKLLKEGTEIQLTSVLIDLQQEYNNLSDEYRKLQDSIDPSNLGLISPHLQKRLSETAKQMGIIFYRMKDIKERLDSLNKTHIKIPGDVQSLALISDQELKTAIDKTEESKLKMLEIQANYFESVGLLREAEEQRLDISLTRELNNLKTMLDEQLITIEQYENARIDLEATAANKRLKLQEQSIDKALEDYFEFLDKVDKEYEKNKQKQIEAEEAYAERIKEIHDGIYQAIASGITNAFLDFIDGSKSAEEAFLDFAATVARKIAELIIMSTILNALIGAGGGAAAGASAGASAGAAEGGAAAGATGGSIMVAKGGVFNQGHIIPMAKGGITNGPQFRPMANGGTALIGEAGPEGVLPLKRTSSGELGVIAQGNTQSSTTQNIAIYAMDSKSFTEFARRNQGAFQAVFADMANRGNSTMRSALTKMTR